MEQGRVTISKAGIHARLNARCSVLAAANPVYGRYDQYKTPMENIGLQDSLLSRFDCLFIMLDLADPESDRKISDHVVRMHRYRAANEQDGEAMPMGLGVDMLSTENPEENIDDNEGTPMYEKYDALLHGNLRSKKDKIVSMKFMQKYIHIAKSIKPVLTREASEVISEEYSRLRSQDTEHTDMARTQPVTARALETLIRLSTAHAKARLSRHVERKDAEAAIDIVTFAYFKKVMEKKKRTRDARESATEEDTDDEQEVSKPKRQKRVHKESDKAKTPKKKPGDEGYDPYDLESAEEMDEEPSQPSAPLRPQALPELSTERLSLFKTTLNKFFREIHSQSSPMTELKKYFKEKVTAEPFTEGEIDAAIVKMSDEGLVMLTDDLLFLI